MLGTRPKEKGCQSFNALAAQFRAQGGESAFAAPGGRKRDRQEMGIPA